MAAKQSRLGLALAGGGFLGAVYELGALSALAESIEGFEPTEAHVYVGVSAGAFISAALANGFSPHQLVRMFVESEDADFPFDPASMIRPAWSQLDPRTLVANSKAIVRAFASSASPSFRSRLWQAADQLAQSVPGYLLSADQGVALARKLFIERGIGDDFRQLPSKLRVVATDFDAGQSIEFGSAGYDDVPISRAILASSAIPGLFKPVAIAGRRYVDGALNKTLHASVALQEGANLILCINPLVPYTAQASRAKSEAPVVGDHLLPVLGQAIRTAIRSRMEVGMQRYRSTHPDADILLLEPASHDRLMFTTHLFSFTGRRELCEHAYQQTRAYLREHAAQLAPVFKRHGMRLRQEVLASEQLCLTREHPWTRHRSEKHLSTSLARLEGTLDDLQRYVRLARLTDR